MFSKRKNDLREVSHTTLSTNSTPIIGESDVAMYKQAAGAKTPDTKSKTRDDSGKRLNVNGDNRREVS